MVNEGAGEAVMKVVHSQVRQVSMLLRIILGVIYVDEWFISLKIWKY